MPRIPKVSESWTTYTIHKATLLLNGLCYVLCFRSQVLRRKCILPDTTHFGALTPLHLPAIVTLVLYKSSQDRRKYRL